MSLYRITLSRQGDRRVRVVRANRPLDAFMNALEAEFGGDVFWDSDDLDGPRFGRVCTQTEKRRGKRSYLHTSHRSKRFKREIERLE